MSVPKDSLELAQAPIKKALEHADTFFEMDQHKNEFLATLAHELRNPLAPIRNGLQLLSMMSLSEEAETVRAMMARQVEQIVHLVDDLLDVSRISCGKVILDKRVVTIRSVVDAAIEESIIIISENGIALEVEDKSHGASVCGDPARLTQVVCNLLNNSAKYGRRGGKIQLRLQVCHASVLVSVMDDGIGIHADRLKDIFNMYSQIESAQGRGSAGLGIGLALVRTLVELHGGYVDVESEGANMGSTFTVRLPLVAARPGESALIKEVAQHSTRSFRVLVVDDLRALRVVSTKLLEKLGHQVQSAENGEEALKMLESFRPDVILSDISMPQMGGHEMARRIRMRADLDGIWLVALTGFGQSTDRELAFESGFDRHVTKPVDFQRLQQLFDELASESNIEEINHRVTENTEKNSRAGKFCSDC